MTFSRTILITMAAAAVFALAAAMPASAQVRAMRGGDLDCLTDRQIQAAIESGQILSWPKIKKLAGISAYEEVSDVEVCMIEDVPYYILNVVSPGGEAAKIALNAVDGTEEVL
jgi:uncharacterized membrane protein YkoI